MWHVPSSYLNVWKRQIKEIPFVHCSGVQSTSFDVFYRVEIVSAVLVYIVHMTHPVLFGMKQFDAEVDVAFWKWGGFDVDIYYVYKCLRFHLQDVETFGPRQHKLKQIFTFKKRFSWWRKKLLPYFVRNSKKIIRF
jgi:hypothetical protein